MFYLVKTPWLLKKAFPECIWNIETTQKIIYLTFDDGPHPDATPFVLSELKKYQAKATFFCIGKNVKENFEIYQQVIREGHRPGNHTFHHLNGWKTKDTEYLNDIAMASELIDTELFRPPYGRITKFQLKALRGERFNLKPIMWDVLSGDFDLRISPDSCYLNVINHAKPGSIVVFHDSQKSLPILKSTLPKVLEYFSQKGYLFQVLPYNN